MKEEEEEEEKKKKRWDVGQTSIFFFVRVGNIYTERFNLHDHALALISPTLVCVLKLSRSDRHVYIEI